MASTLDVSPEIRAMVCDACWRDVFTVDAFKILLGTEGTAPDKFSYITTPESIATSAEQGCSWCTFLTEKTKQTKGDVKISLSIKPEDRTITPAGAKRLHVNTSGVQNLSGSYSSYMLYTTSGDNASAIITPKDRVLNVGADLSFEMALERLANCLKTHEHCPKPSQENVLPDRVIDCSDLEHPKVVLTKGEMKGAYATLSYVWGKGEKQPYSLKSTNIDVVTKEGFEYARLPKTIQDAIISTRKFGLRYMWVDSLCIIQDNDDDKMQQMGKMNVIYRGAYTTIIAASANSVQEGFLQDRPARIPAARIPFVCLDGKVGTMNLANLNWDYYDARHAYYDVIEPVNGRGWCMQERFLSERAFIFASDTLRYYCQKETVSIGDALCEPSTSMTLPRSIFLPDYKLTDEELVKARQAWQYVVWDYTRRALGWGGVDKLNAVGGIAEQFSTVWKDSRYLAGIWEHTLLEDILWSLSHAAEPAARPEKYRAPSWSWASIDGLVDGTTRSRDLKVGSPGLLLCEVLKCEVTLVSDKAPFAAVKAANLDLKGQLTKVTTTIPTSSSSSWPLFIGSEEIGWVNIDALNDIKESDQLFVLPVLWNSPVTSAQALVLADAGEGKYRRVGILSHSPDKHSLAWVGIGDIQEIVVI